ncbi:DUF1003 domain-containing protein [Allocoleopsis sp.]|uniref:DUF1003 domain-containing protein n=1 Tax=Allocoleopsis sp. TaxID=3088169 RepID=UPI002FD5011F
MNSAPSTQPSINESQQAPVVLKQPQSGKIKPPEKKPLTFGQKVADKMATKVGSWAFLIGQSTILTGWVGLNLMPGVPHWDESPFILLNLVFSFASAYTAPVVLMSQNRQSEEDRESANHNYQVTLQAAQNLELLHEKLDAQYAKKLDELIVLIKQQQQASNEVKVVFVPTQQMNEFEHRSHKIATMSILNPHSNKQAS